MQENPSDVKEGIESQIKEYQKLKSIGNNKEFNDYFDMLLKTVAEKMLWAFTTGKDGDNVKTWDDFCKVRGEIVARLQPIQEVRDADAMIDYLKTQLDQYYKQPV